MEVNLHLSYGLPTTIIASEDHPAIVKRGDHRRGVDLASVFARRFPLF